MEAFSVSVVNGDPGLAGLKVAEQLQTLRVACEGTCRPGGAAEEGKEGAALPVEGCPGGSHVGERRSPYPGPCGGLVGPAAAGEVAVEEGPPPLGNGSPSSHSGWTGPRGNLGEGAEPGPEEKPRSGREAGPEGESKADPVEGGSLGPDPKSSPSPLDPPTSLASEWRPTAPGRGREAASVMESSGDSSSTSSSESESESESDTDTDSSSSDSSSSSCLPMLSEDDDGHQQNKNEDNSWITTKNGELSQQEPLCIEDVKIILPESVELMPFGKVSSIIGHQVIIESQKGLPPVNEDTVLFRDDRHSIGKVFEVFGPVSHPFYVLQFSSPEHIEAKGIKIHDAVYFAPSVESFTQYIFPEKLKQEKGSDASWKNDEEPPPEALDFSDDEKEKAAKQQKKSQNLRRKKFRSQQDCNENGINYKPRQQYPSDYSGRYCRGEPRPTFSRGRFPHASASPRFFRHQARTPQHYSRCAEPWKPSTFCQQQRPESLRRHQYSFPPPTFETVNNETNFPPLQQSVTWGWPPGYTQNICDPLLSLLSLPPPPPPPVPPPPAVAPFDSINPP